jgi:hypothetical protein
MIGRTRQLLQGTEKTLIRPCMPFLVHLKLKLSGNREEAILRGENYQIQYQ